MKLVSQDEYEAESCPQCGGKTVVISEFDDGSWLAVCKNCQYTPGTAPSKRHAKLSWKTNSEDRYGKE